MSNKTEYDPVSLYNISICFRMPVSNSVPSTLFRTYGTYDRGIYAAHVTSFHCTLIYNIDGRAFGQNYMFHKCYVQPQVTNARFSALVFRIIREKQYHYANVSR